MRDLLDELGLVPFVETTGKRGLHVVVPVTRTGDFDTVGAFALDVARVLAARDPDRLTVEFREQRRRGRLFVDTLRNGYAQTAVAPYSLRAVDGATVATPLEWEELAGLDPRRYTLVRVPKRLVDEVG